MSNVETLLAKLKSDGLAIGGMTLGPNATAEGVAGEMLRSLEAIENGDYEIIHAFED